MTAQDNFDMGLHFLVLFLIILGKEKFHVLYRPSSPEGNMKQNLSRTGVAATGPRA